MLVEPPSVRIGRLRSRQCRSYVRRRVGRKIRSVRAENSGIASLRAKIIQLRIDAASAKVRGSAQPYLGVEVNRKRRTFRVPAAAPEAA